MDKGIDSWLMGVIGVAWMVLVFWFGWVGAHATVRHECTVIGAFYVGDKVFDCRLRER